MVPLVFVINGLTKGRWHEAFFFALAVAVGLTPEMLPMIVTVCLSKGAMAMARKKVIVKRINAIQNLGAMDVLCTDKTGTLTMDHVILERHCDVVAEGGRRRARAGVPQQPLPDRPEERARPRRSRASREAHARARSPSYAKVDEIPFDFQRRIMSVVVRTPEGKDRIISKGAPEAIFPRCTNFELDGELLPMDHVLIDELRARVRAAERDGFRVLAIAHEGRARRRSGGRRLRQGRRVRPDPQRLRRLPRPAEGDARPRPSRRCEQHGVAVKVVTGDNDLVARKVCREVGLATEHTLLGGAGRGDDRRTSSPTPPSETTLFARVSPAHKQRIIQALQSRGHTVGFMGDGINDAPALRAADVGISVDTAVDIAKESADMILLEKILLVLEEGVLEGRKVFANILKYVRMGASSNFGNMFSVLGASVFVPFLPMTPIQILTNNLLYDISQTAIPTDDVDPEQIAKPRPWDIGARSRGSSSSSARARRSSTTRRS